MANPNTRAPREAEEGRLRRRRLDGTLDRMQELRMSVPPQVREQNPDREFRWFNDTGNRIHNKTVMDDWDKVDGVDPLIVGTNRDGTPLKAYLCMKPTEFIREDEQRKMAELESLEKGLARGNTDERDLNDRSYIPDGERNQFGRVKA